MPIWFGGFSEAQQNRCARIGDGFTFMRMSRLAFAAVGSIKEKPAALGRDPEALGFETILDSEGDELHDEIGRWAAANGTHVGVRIRGTGEGLLDGLETMAADLGDLLTGGA